MTNHRPRNSIFHAFTVKYTGITNRLITEIGLRPAHDPSVPFSNLPPLYKTGALWDTGATASVITQNTAQAMKLTPVGSTLVNHAGGTSPSRTYLVNITLPNNVNVAGVLVTECHDVAGNFGAIIGMDIIAKGDFSLTCADGKSTMSFRIPSISEMDYVKEADRITYAGIGRNDPCPCGAKGNDGKPLKFKFCHGR